jgi:hypothetical protein
MGRLFWLLMGFGAGVAYVARQVRDDRADIVPEALSAEERAAWRTRVADEIETRASMASEQVLELGHTLAARLRGDEIETISASERTQPVASPYGVPTAPAGEWQR